jgi:hypothetical protein
VASDGKITVNGELEEARKEDVLAYLKAVFYDSSDWVEESHEIY